MGNMYVALDTASTKNIIDSLAAALVTKYGGGVNFHYQSNTILIFRCPAISDKYIRFYLETTSENYMNFGSGYDSGSTSVNGIRMTFHYARNTLEYHLVLGDSFMFMTTKASDTEYNSAVVIGKTKAGISICFGAGVSNSAWVEYTAAMDATNNKEIDFLCLSQKLYSSDGVPYIMPLIIFEKATGLPLTCADGSFDTIEGLYMSCYNGGLLIRENAMFSPNYRYVTTTEYTRLRTSLVAMF